MATEIVTPLTIRVKRVRILHLEYEVWAEADRFYCKALHTGAVRKFLTPDALNGFVTRLTWYVHWKYSTFALPAPRPEFRAVIALEQLAPRDAQMMVETGQPTPYRAYQAKYQQWVRGAK